MKNTLLLFISYILFNIFNAAADAKKPVSREYSWEENTKLAELTAKEKTEPSIVLLDKRIIEYVYDESGGLNKYYVRHRRVAINSKEHIDLYNKIKIYINNVDELIQVKARAISPSGKVTELKQSAIKEVENEEDGKYKLIALEGLEPGCEIEYYFVEKIAADYFNEEYLQAGIPVKRSYLELRSPENLKFEIKSYNGNIIQTDTSIEKERILTVTIQDIPALNDEKYSFFNANLLRVEYKLAYNSARNNSNRILNWTDAGKRYHELIYLEKADPKSIKKLVKGLKPESQSNIDKARALEAYIKSNIDAMPHFNIEEETIKSILNDRRGSRLGIMRLYMNALKELNINAEIVLTSNRTKRSFDPKFDSWNFIEEMLIYLPDEDKFICPTNTLCRIGYIDTDFLDNDALFISNISLGGQETGLATVNKIPYPGADFSFDNMEINVNLEKNLSSANLVIKRAMQGYSSSDLRGAYFLMQEDKRKELAEGILKSSDKDAKLKNLKVTNININSSEVDKPLVLEGELQSQNLIEQANDKYLLKIGEIIGPQEEMYQEKPRQTPAQLTYPHGYYRKIVVNIPEGYTVSGLEALKMNHEYGSSNNKPDLKFTSDYKLNGQTLEIEIYESYNKIVYPLAVFDKFKEVINAAANFNKVVLVLKKA